MPKPSPFKVPTRSAVASLALLSVVSAIEKQREKKRKPEDDFSFQDMSGELQTIPARHGVATFVPRGRTIKIINTYGKQVVSTWAFGLHAPPEEGDNDEGQEAEEEIEERTEKLKEELDNEEAEGIKQTDAAAKEKKDDDDVKEEKDDVTVKEKEDNVTVEEKKGDQAKEGESEDKKESSPQSEDANDPPEQAPDTPENEKSTGENQDKKAEKRTWSSYLPSIPYRSKGAPASQADAKPDPETEKAQNAASKKWSSYLPTGQSFSSYVPNVQLPDSKGVVSAFQSSHHRDPNKSYAEQLYDFSKTPVGAGSIAGNIKSTQFYDP